VVRGPNSALFGFNAASGVINIITYDPARDRVSSAVLRGGMGYYREASGVATAPLGEDGGIRLSAGLRGEKAWRSGYSEFETTALDARRSPSRVQLASEVSLQLAPNVQAGLTASYSRAIGGDFMDYGQFWREDKRVWSLGGRLAVTTEHGLLDAQIYHNALNATYAATPHPTDHHLTVAEIGYAVKPAAAHTLRPLLQLRHATMSMLPGTEVRYAVVGAGLMWDWAASDSLELTTSVRYDRLWLGARGYDDPAFPYGDKDYDRALGEVSWNAALVWHATPKDTLRVSGARGVSLPSLSDLGWRDSYPEFGYQDTGTPSLSPTVVHSYELEYRRQIEAIDGRASILGFVEHYSGFSSGLSTASFVPPAVPYNTYAPFNLGHAVLFGSEASLTGKAGEAVDWGLRYRLSVPSSDFRASAQDPTHGSPRHLATARLGWRRDALELDLFTRYSSVFRAWRATSEEATALAEAKDYVSVAARVAYRLTDRLTLALEGENLLHQRQSQTLAAVAERRVYLSLRADF
jgi:iron complex outermembrane receptor protein